MCLHLAFDISQKYHGNSAGDASVYFRFLFESIVKESGF